MSEKSFRWGKFTFLLLLFLFLFLLLLLLFLLLFKYWWSKLWNAIFFLSSFSFCFVRAQSAVVYSFHE
jgi:hypothetical protein